MAQQLDIGDVSRMLNSRIVTLAAELLPHGVRRGAEWVVGSPAGEPGDNMAVHLTGPKAGVWRHFAGTEGGDALDLVAVVRFAGSKSDALRWARGWLGIGPSASPATLAAARAAAAPDPQLEIDAAKEAERRRRTAHMLWLAGQRELAGSPVDWYLLARGIDLSEMARPPRAIRYHPHLWHAISQRHWPAMMTAITGPGGRFVAVHRTYIEVLQNGQARKAPIEGAKRVIGTYAGGHIALARGRTNKPYREAEAGETLDITEGIEDGLTVAVYNPDFRVIAAVSLSNLANLVLPEAIATLRIWRQVDTKRPALESFDRAIANHLRAGRRVLFPQLAPDTKDINEMMAR